MSEHDKSPVKARVQISFEGKIGIALALLGLLGAGAIMVAPQALWIGWTLIGVAVVGLLWLGIHHVGSVVAPTANCQERKWCYMGNADDL